MLLERDGVLRTARLRTDSDGAMKCFTWGEVYTALELMLRYHVELASAEERAWLLAGVAAMQVPSNTLPAKAPTLTERACLAVNKTYRLPEGGAR